MEEKKEEKKEEIFENIKNTKQYLEQVFQDCADVNIREYQVPKMGKCLVVFLETTLNTFDITDLQPVEKLEQAMDILLAGNGLLFCEKPKGIYKIGSKGYPSMGVPKADMEKVLRGSQEGFGESVKMNVALVRKRLRTSKLKNVEMQVGEKSDTVISLVYLENRIPPGLLENIQSRLEQVKIGSVMDSGILEHRMDDPWYSPFPRFQTTQRPDRAAWEIMSGRILLLSDNSPVGLILPTVFGNFLQASEDQYNRKEIVTFIKGLRYLALVLATMLSGLYLAVTTFHTQMLPVHLILSFAAARQGVPFSGLMEVLILELAFELIREAGVRMPGPLGGTIGIVGGLIIGDAAVSANLASPIVVIIVALTALGSFAIPNEEFAATFRVLKYGFIFLGSFFGLPGIVIGLFALLEHLAGLTSFEIPYLSFPSKLVVKQNK